MSTGSMLFFLLLSVLALLAPLPLAHAFSMVASPSRTIMTRRIGGPIRHPSSPERRGQVMIIPTTTTTTTALAATRDSFERRAFVVAALGSGVPLLSTTSAAVWADVADGNALPKEAQQFANVIQLKNNIKVRSLRFLFGECVLVCFGKTEKGYISVTTS